MVVVMATSDFSCTQDVPRKAYVLITFGLPLYACSCICCTSTTRPVQSRPICGESWGGLETELWEDHVTKGAP
jgi:hypothetical protein